MKTLDQVEARKPIGPSTTPITIGAPGSYYLAGDIAVTGTGITITSGDVTLDLNGFTVRKSSGTGGTGIIVGGPADNSARNVTIRNGHVSGTFSSGINIQRAHNVTIEDMAIQGTQNTGIEVPLSTLSTNVIAVRRCRVLGEPVDRRQFVRRHHMMSATVPEYAGGFTTGSRERASCRPGAGLRCGK